MNVNQIEAEVTRLDRRVKRLHSGDWAAIGFSNGGWYVRCPFGTVLPGRGDTPAEAFNEFERQLKIIETRTEALAETLGVVETVKSRRVGRKPSGAAA